MRTVITYGTYDLFHEGHRRLLERARELGDRLIVGVTSDAYDRSRGKLNVIQSLPERIENVRRTGLVDQIVVEEYDGQKIHDIQKWGADVFAIGSDWLGKFDYLFDYCEVIYLERTRGVSSTQLRTEASGILRVGLVGTGSRAQSLVEEARFVSGISVEAVWDANVDAARMLAERMELEWVNDTYDDLIKHVDVVHISTPVSGHADLIRRALEQGVHVLCEPPLTLTRAETEDLYARAKEAGVVLMEGFRTAYSPGFLRMVAYARSGTIGQIRSVDVRRTQVRALRHGSVEQLLATPLLAVVKLLGTEFESVAVESMNANEDGSKALAKVEIRYPTAVASVTVGTGVLSANDLVVSGTEGYLYVPEPWWVTDHFETRFEESRRNQRFFVPFEGTGRRYELAELAGRIRGVVKRSYKVRTAESLAIAAIVQQVRTSVLS